MQGDAWLPSSAHFPQHLSSAHASTHHHLQGTTFKRVSAWPDRPGPGWAYPQTGQGILLPMEYPYTKMEFIAAGGSRKDNATQFTPASDAAWKIDVSAVEWSGTGGLCE